MDTQNRKHYIAGSGSHGCMYDHSEVYQTRAEAVDDLAALFELGRTRKADLAAHDYLELGRRDGADYCEITECMCPHPEVHCDSD